MSNSRAKGLSATLGSKCIDPDSRQIKTAVFTALPDVRWNFLTEEWFLLSRIVISLWKIPPLNPVLCHLNPTHALISYAIQIPLIILITSFKPVSRKPLVYRLHISFMMKCVTIILIILNAFLCTILPTLAHNRRLVYFQGKSPTVTFCFSQTCVNILFK